MRACAPAFGGRGRVRTALTGSVVMLVSGTLAAQASAASIAVNKPCYVNAASRAAAMTVSGSGFTPGDPVDIQSSDGSVAATANAGASGAFAVTTGAPTPFLPRPESKTFTLTASDFTATGTTITATTRVTVTDLSVTTAPSRAALTEKVTWYFSGFDPGKQIYGHYLRRNEVARAEFGTAQGPCGLLKVNARFYPGGHPRYKTYTLQVDNSKPYSMHTTPRVLAQLGTMFF